MTVNSVLKEVKDERYNQDVKWGKQNHGDPMWGLILGEEFGEVCMAILHQPEVDPTLPIFKMTSSEDVRAELVQVAAVAVAWIECIDRRGIE